MVLVVAAILVDDLTEPTRLLAARRTAPPELAGRWEFPGGKVEAGELPEAALHREVREELDVEITIGAELPGPADGRWPISDTIAMRAWLAVLHSGRPSVTAGHDELRWLSADELSGVDWLSPDLPLVAVLRLRLSGDVRTA